MPCHMSFIFLGCFGQDGMGRQFPPFLCSNCLENNIKLGSKKWFVRYCYSSVFFWLPPPPLLVSTLVIGNNNTWGNREPPKSFFFGDWWIVTGGKGVQCVRNAFLFCLRLKVLYLNGKWRTMRYWPIRCFQTANNNKKKTPQKKSWHVSWTKEQTQVKWLEEYPPHF